MNSAAPIETYGKPQAQDIVVDEVLPHAPETIWKALTDGALIKRWLMEPSGFAPVVGNRFTYQTKPAGAWDGTIRCEVLEVIPQQRLIYAWRSGDGSNVGYGAPLDTLVTWSLTKVPVGTRLRMVHSGFVTPKNDVAYENMSNGWKTVIARLGQAIGEEK
jgi:uncharacterized protein YndB with AHSA1/START domain